MGFVLDQGLACAPLFLYANYARNSQFEQVYKVMYTLSLNLGISLLAIKVNDE